MHSPCALKYLQEECLSVHVLHFPSIPPLPATFHRSQALHASRILSRQPFAGFGYGGLAVVRSLVARLRPLERVALPRVCGISLREKNSTANRLCFSERQVRLYRSSRGSFAMFPSYRPCRCWQVQTTVVLYSTYTIIPSFFSLIPLRSITSTIVPHRIQKLTSSSLGCVALGSCHRSSFLDARVATVPTLVHHALRERFVYVRCAGMI